MLHHLRPPLLSLRRLRSFDRDPKTQNRARSGRGRSGSDFLKREQTAQTNLRGGLLCVQRLFAFKVPCSGALET
jgi:hypothetical protein